MADTIDHFIEILLDDDKFINYLKGTALLNNSTIKKIEIPKHSFTSHQLSYSSAEEISQNHRSVLLGGIPNIWNVQHSYSIFALLSKLSEKRLRKRITYVYDKGKRREEKIVHWREYQSAVKNEAYEAKIKPSKLVISYDQGQNAALSQSVNSNATFVSTSNDKEIDAEEGEGEEEDSVESIDVNQETSSECTSLDSSYNIHSPQRRASVEDSVYFSADEDVVSSIREYVPKRSARNLISFPQVSSQSSISTDSMKRSTLNKEQLQILQPIPEHLSLQEHNLVKKSQKHYDPLKSIGKTLKPQIHQLYLDNLFNWNDKIKHHLPQQIHNLQVGTIIKMEKMIVMIKQALTTKIVPTHFSEDEPIDTRIYERWKEYIVVARATNITDAPIMIQLYASRKINAVEPNNRKPWYCKVQFLLDTKCLVEFYNSLDKSICIVKQDDLLTREMRYAENTKTKADLRKPFSPLRIFIFRCDNLLSSSRWLIFLRSAIGLALSADNIDIHIPKINLTVNIDLPELVKHKLSLMAEQEENIMKLLYLDHGYRILQLPIMRYLKLIIRQKILQLDYKDLVSKWDSSDLLMGLCWKHYDRLEWSFGNQKDLLYGSFVLRKSHLLEYRELESYPMTVKISENLILQEPPPVEGFLAKNKIIYNKSSHKFSQPYFKLAYWFSSNGMLFMTRPKKASPPLPSDDIIDAYGFVKDKKKLAEVIKSLPEVFEHNPYPLNESNHISWLNTEMSDDHFNMHDAKATNSFLRKVSLILKSDYCIDLTKCQDIQLFSEKDVSNSTIKVWCGANNVIWKNNQIPEETRESIIELTLDDSKRLLLLAANPQICQEWLIRLRNISRYWKEKLKKDEKMLWELKFRNLKTFNIDESQEKYVSSSAPKWMTEKSYTNPCIYNVSTHAKSRPLIHQGLIYHKARKHAVFSKHFMVLIPGFVILYHCFNRSFRGYVRNRVEYNHYMTIPIEKSYVYSGTLTEQELLNRDKEFNSINPGSHSLCRVYEDGWKSMDEESSRTFVMWFPNKRILLDPSNENENISTTSKVKVVDKLGVSGRSMVFMCRSRQERDLWMVKLYDELERTKML